MKILVTGINGFMGMAVAKQLMQDTAIEVVGTGLEPTCRHSFFSEYYSCDLSDDVDVYKLGEKIGNCDVIVHAAAMISFDNSNGSVIDVNVKATLHCAHLALQTKCAQFVFISSIPIIGTPPTEGVITETYSPQVPHTLYHLTKLFGEYILNLPCFMELKTCTLRIAAPISPSMPENRMLPIFLRKAMLGQPVTLNGTGSRVQNYVDIRDVGRAIELVIRSGGEGLYLLNGESHSNFEVATLCNKIAGSNAGVCYSGIPDKEDNYKWIICADKISSKLGFHTHFTLEATLREMKDLIDSEAHQ